MDKCQTIWRRASRTRRHSPCLTKEPLYGKGSSSSQVVITDIPASLLLLMVLFLFSLLPYAVGCNEEFQDSTIESSPLPHFIGSEKYRAPLAKVLQGEMQFLSKPGNHLIMECNSKVCSSVKDLWH